MADAAVLEDIRVIDTDTHVSEPADLWTSRVPARWVDEVPAVGIHPETGHRHWKVGDTWLASTGFFAYAGSKDYPPRNHRELEDADPGSWNAADRLAADGRVRHLRPGAVPEPDRLRVAAVHGSRLQALAHLHPRSTTTSSSTSPAPTRSGSSRSRWCRSGTWTPP